MKKEFKRLRLDEIKPYERNPRHNDEAVDDVVASIEQCGNIDPIEIDEDGVILSGHTRLKALQRRGETETDCIVVSGLTEEQKRKYRILANKTGEKATWDWELLQQELETVDLQGYDFGFEIEAEGGRKPESLILTVQRSTFRSTRSPARSQRRQSCTTSPKRSS